MSTQIQRRRGTTAQHASFTGAVGETTIDTDKEVVVVHDGVQVGGYPLMRENGSNSALALGSAGTPSLKFTGDTNTGIYSPGADQVAISTAGSGRLFVGADGKVSVGNSAITVADGAMIGAASSTGARLKLCDSDLGVTATDGLEIFAADGGDAYIWQRENNPLLIGTNGSERLRITSAGLVGVGTSSPSYKLDVNGEVAFSPNTAGKNTFYFTTNASNDASLFLKSDTTNKVNIQANGTSYFNGGNVGIGTSSPGSVLNIKGTAANGFSLTHSNNTVIGGIYELSGAQGAGMELKNSSGTSNIFFNAGGDSYINGGKLGIGTTSPAEKFDVRRSGYGNVAFFADDSASGLFIKTSSGAAGLDSRNNTTALNFLIDGSEKARLDTSGRLLVGTSSATNNIRLDQKLALVAVGSNAYAGTQITSYAGATTEGCALIELCRSRGTTDGSLVTAVSGDRLGVIQFRGTDGANFIDAASIECRVDGTPGTNDMPGRLVFSTCGDGASSPTERMRINNSGTIYGFSSDLGLWQTISAAAGTTQPIFRGSHSGSFIGGGTTSYYVYSNGNVQNTNGSYTAISDAKLKENIVDASSQWDDLKSIQIRNWNFKAETGHETHRQIGPIAQELETVCPGLVFETPDRDADGNETGEVTKGVNQSVLYMKAVKALQEAMERIETLEAKVAALESA